MKKYFVEGLSQSNGFKREPLRTFGEFIEEFGVKRHSFQGMLSRRDAPKPVLKHHGSLSNVNTYYNVKEMRAWWALQPESKKVAA